MLISEKINKIDDILEKHNKHAHYAMHEHLRDDFNRLEYNLKSELENENREYQAITTQWLREQNKEILQILKEQANKQTSTFLEDISNALKNSINNDVNKTLENIHTKIDVPRITLNLKNDKVLVSRIESNAKNELVKILEADSHNIKESAKQSLIERLGQDDSIRNSVNRFINNNKDFQAKILDKAKEQTSSILQQQTFKQFIESSLNNLNSTLNTELENTKNKLNAGVEKLKSEIQKKADNLVIDKVAIQQLVVKRLVQEHLDNKTTQNEIKQEIIKTGFNEINKYSTNMQESIINKGLQHLKDSINVDLFLQQALKDESIIEDILQEADNTTRELLSDSKLNEFVINFMFDYVREQISIESFLQDALRDEGIREEILTQAYFTTRELVDNATLKDMIVSSLKEKAKEILSTDELLRYNAGAQAHLTAMQLQSKLASMTEVMDKLSAEYETQLKLDLLVQQEKLYNEMIQKAKEQLQQILEDIKNNKPLSQELQDYLKDLIADVGANTLPESVKKYIQEQIQNYDKEQDKEIDLKDTNLEKLMREYVDNLIAKLEKDLQDSIKPNTPNTPQDKQGFGYLLWEN